MDLLRDLLANFESKLETITLIPAGGGKFEVTLDEQLIFSKSQSGRHPEAGEGVTLLKEPLK